MIRRCAVSYIEKKNPLGSSLFIILEHASSYHDISEVRLRTPLDFHSWSGEPYRGKKEMDSTHPNDLYASHVHRITVQGRRFYSDGHNV